MIAHQDSDITSDCIPIYQWRQPHFYGTSLKSFLDDASSGDSIFPELRLRSKYQGNPKSPNFYLTLFLCSLESLPTSIPPHPKWKILLPLHLLSSHDGVLWKFGEWVTSPGVISSPDLDSKLRSSSLITPLLQHEMLMAAVAQRSRYRIMAGLLRVRAHYH
ncbi:hypothetical protein TNCV_330081 [Trichonephila clavipes]|nr:hypothetical protein TNCV_330081 [Trichonephila clavipes]